MENALNNGLSVPTQVPHVGPSNDDRGTLRLTGSTLTAMFLATVIMPDRVPEGTKAAYAVLQALVLGAIPLSISTVARTPEIRSILKLASVLLVFSHLYGVIGALQLVLVPQWQDHRLIALDNALWGDELSQLLKPFRNRILSEGLMYAYVAYIPALFMTGLLCLRTGGRHAIDEYAHLLVKTYIVCFAGFLLFPVASQGFIDPAHFNGELSGGLFTSLAESLRSDVHFPGGSLPSAHCAGTSIMLVMLWRHNRRAFLVLAPTLLLVYPATVYGQFHYAWDGVAGIITAFAVVRWSARKHFNGRRD